MGALSRILGSAITRQHAPDRSNTAIATSAMSTSATAMQVLGATGLKHAGSATYMVKAIGKPGKVNQGVSDNFARKAGEITADYQQLKAIEPTFNRAMDDWKNGQALRGKMAVKAAQSAQAVGVTNASAQSTIGHGHQASHTNIVYHQTAYGGASFGV